MNVLKFMFGLILLAALVMLVQLPETPMGSPAAQFQQLPDVRPPAALAAGSSYQSLAGSTIADLAMLGELPQQAEPEFAAALERIRPMSAVFAPAEAVIVLAKAAQRPAINPALMKHLSQTLVMIENNPRSPLAVEKFRDNFMPMFELAKHCRTWEEFQTILRQADSPDQAKVLAKMTTDGAQKLSTVLAVAGLESRACLDYIMRQGPVGLETLYAALPKGVAGLKFVLDHPGLTSVPAATKLTPMQEKYQTLRQQYGAAAPAVKYLLIAILCAFLVLVAVPGRYLEKLVTRPGSPVPSPGAAHYFLSALAVGVVLAGLAYLLSLAVRPAALPVAPGPGGEAPALAQGVDNALLSGTVVLISLAIHAVVWFFVRGKLRQVEDDDTSSPALRLKRLDNLDVFLDLPLFTGLALTVCAFILITINAGMSRHFAYTATVVGILSAVSLRIRYQYPLKERLTQLTHS